jgi:hypothetical protein
LYRYTGVIQYQPQANIHGQDFMTYYGLVAENIALARGLVDAELVDCDNRVEDMCVTAGAVYRLNSGCP